MNEEKNGTEKDGVKPYDDDGFWEDRTPQNPQNNGNPPPMSGVKAKSANRNRNLLIGLGAVALAVAFFFIGWLSHFYSLSKEERKLLWIFDRVESDYYRKLTDAEREAYFDNLYDAAMPDIFSTYFSPSDFEKLNSEREGSNADTGFSAFMDGDDLRVFLVQGNSPADLAGVKSGMTIYGFGKDGSSLQSGNYDDLVSFVRSNRGTFVLDCGYTEESKQVRALESAEYLASYCSYADSSTSFEFRTVMENGKQVLKLTDTGTPVSGLDDKTAYLRFTEFGGNAASEFRLCLEKMKAQGRENLVIDLRCNGGGYLDILQEISSHLLRNAEGETPVVAAAKYRTGQRTSFRATGNDFKTYFGDNARISVLADENSASASECLIGALVDYGTIKYDDIYVRNDKAGEGRTYGKGVMQSAYMSADGSALRLTSAEICWPNGKSIHGKGVTEAVDGAIGITAPMIRGEEDTFLTQALARICG